MSQKNYSIYNYQAFIMQHSGLHSLKSLPAARPTDNILWIQNKWRLAWFCRLWFAIFVLELVIESRPALCTPRHTCRPRVLSVPLQDKTRKLCTQNSRRTRANQFTYCTPGDSLPDAPSVSVPRRHVPCTRNSIGLESAKIVLVYAQCDLVIKY